MSGNLFARFRDAAPAHDRTFIKTPDGRVIAYGDLFAISARYAHVLRAAGVRFGDRVAVQVEKSPEAILLYLACLRLGAVYLPLNTAYTLVALAYFIGDAEPAVVVCTPERAGEIAARLSVRTILTLDNDGRTGSLIELAKDQPSDFA